jgi:hypothetical protein
MPGGYHNQARMTIGSSGTTTFSLSAAVSGFNTFALAGVLDGEIVPYAANDTQTNNSEEGWGLYNTSGSSTGGPSLTRNVFTSTNGGALVAFSSSGTQVFITPSSVDFMQVSLYGHANLGGL